MATTQPTPRLVKPPARPTSYVDPVELIRFLSFTLAALEALEKRVATLEAAVTDVNTNLAASADVQAAIISRIEALEGAGGTP